MRYRSPHDAPEPLWRRLDRTAKAINPFLIVVAIGLGLLDLTCFVAVLIPATVTRTAPVATLSAADISGAGEPPSAPAPGPLR